MAKKAAILNEIYMHAKERIWRPEAGLIFDMVDKNSVVLSLGCGDGSLEEKLIKNKNCKVIGLDISDEAVKIAKNNGVSVVVGDLEEKLDFKDNFADYVILCDVLEHLLDPLFALKESVRISKKKIIVAFPNFSFLKSRIELLFDGTFPKTPLFGFNWYNSQHIRLFSRKDFLASLEDLNFNLKVVNEKFISPQFIPKFLIKLFPNLLSMVCVIELEKQSGRQDIKNYKFDV